MGVAGPQGNFTAGPGSGHYHFPLHSELFPLVYRTLHAKAWYKWKVGVITPAGRLSTVTTVHCTCVFLLFKRGPQCVHQKFLQDLKNKILSAYHTVGASANTIFPCHKKKVCIKLQHGKYKILEISFMAFREQVCLV